MSSGSAILIEASPGEVRGALIRNGDVWDVVHHRITRPSLIDAVYRGRVRRIDPGINGAFVDIGQGPEAFCGPVMPPSPANAPRAARGSPKSFTKVRRSTCGLSPTGFVDKGPRVARIATVDGACGEKRPPNWSRRPIRWPISWRGILRIVCGV